MPYRIIYCALTYASLLMHVPHETLRSLDQGVIAAVSDDALKTLLEKEPNLPILYFSRESYDHAIEGLADADIDHTLRLRLRWSPDSLNASIAWIGKEERPVLSLTAQQWLASTGAKASLLADHFNTSLEWLTGIKGNGRYNRWRFQELVSAIREADALLIAELEQSPEAQIRTEFAGDLAREMKLRHHDYPQLLPHVDRQRGVWVSPADDSVKAYLRSREMGSWEWQGGAVVTLSADIVDEFRKQGKRVELLYFDATPFAQDSGQLSQAQLNRILDRLLKADAAARTQQKNDYLNLRRLDVALMRRYLRIRARKEDRALTSLLDQQISRETAILSRQIVEGNSWLPGNGMSTLAQLRAGEEAMIRDANFFLTVAQYRKDDDLVHTMLDMSREKQRALNQLDTIKP